MGGLKKAGQVLFGIVCLGLLVFGLWQEVLALTRPFAYYFGHTAPGRVESSTTFRMSRWVTVDYTDDAAKEHEVSVKVIDFFDADVADGKDVTVHYFPWLASHPCLNGHWIDDPFTLLVWAVLIVLALLVPFGLWGKLTVKRTAV